LGELLATVDAKKIERIIVAPDDRRGAVPVQELLQLKLQGVEIEQGITFYERATGKSWRRSSIPARSSFPRALICHG